MKVILLAGGFGTRLQEETHRRPKPMVEIGGRPILWHIMKHFRHHGLKDFVVACGYMGDYIKNYFLSEYDLSGAVTIDFAASRVERLPAPAEDWRVSMVDTGLHTNTGGRLRRLRDEVGTGTFLLTYGDGVSNVDVPDLIKFHKSQGRIATVTAVRPPARFGGLTIQDGRVDCFSEKPQTGEGWINGGFMVLEPEVFDYLDGDACSLEAHALEAIANDGQLSAYCHSGFWQCMDTLRDRNFLESLWDGGEAPWKTWASRPDSPLRLVTDSRAA